jgi:colicin import membrane protein
MARQTYPLEALRKLRDERAEALLHALAEQVGRTQGAAATLAAREQARREHAARTAEAVRAEQRRLAEGGVSGVDLLRVADFEQAARAQAGLLERAESEARQRFAQERAAEQKLREEQAAREAEAKLVRNHEASFHEGQADLIQKAEEEAALEQWNARRH